MDSTMNMEVRSTAELAMDQERRKPFTDDEAKEWWNKLNSEQKLNFLRRRLGVIEEDLQQYNADWEALQQNQAATEAIRWIKNSGRWESTQPE